MEYRIVYLDHEQKRQYLYGTFYELTERARLFVSYMLNVQKPENVYIIETETGEALPLAAFAAHYHISAGDVKKR